MRSVFEQFIIIQASIEAKKQEMKSNKKDYDEKMRKSTEEFKAMLAAIKDQINNLKYLLTHKDSPNPLDPTNVVPTNRRAPPLEGGQHTKIVGMWTLKH